MHFVTIQNEIEMLDCYGSYCLIGHILRFRFELLQVSCVAIKCDRAQASLI
jgi:hypothetical protein